MNRTRQIQGVVSRAADGYKRVNSLTFRGSRAGRMYTIADLVTFLEQFAPPSLAESWDNVGLLVGDRSREATKVMTCLTITPASAAEAVERSASLIVTHHPLPFRPLNRLTADTTDGKLLLQLIENRIAIYSPHTAFDSARDGINQRLANGLGLRDAAALLPAADGELGAGRFGMLPQPLTLAQLAGSVKTLLQISRLQCVGPLDRPLGTVAVACGSGGDFLGPARAAGCDALVTGEARFHACLEAEATGTALVLAGHFASERFAVLRLAEVLAQAFSALQIWASEKEADPLAWV